MVFPISSSQTNPFFAHDDAPVFTNQGQTVTIDPACNDTAAGLDTGSTVIHPGLGSGTV
jgi:hypothetical protein